MRKVISLIVTIVAIAVTSCARSANNGEIINTKTTSTEDMETSINGKKTLVVFFSHTGENYGVGNITEGNTHIIAKMIAEATDAAMFEIVPEKEYPHDSYDAVVEIAKNEKAEKARPAIKDDVNVEDYEVIFIGYPNWWADMPMPVYTFIEKHDWQDKTVVPFCTHEGSGLSQTEKYIANACAGSVVKKGLAVKGSTAQNNRAQAEKTVASWLEQLKKPVASNAACHCDGGG